MNSFKKHYLTLALFIIIPTFFTVSPLTAYGDDFVTDDIIVAADSGNWNRVKELVQQGKDINGKDYFSKKTVLHYAANIGNLELVQWLVGHGADVNAKDNEERTVLGYAARNGNLELVQLLIRYGADVKNDSSVLHSAAESGNLEMVQWLIKYGLDINAQDSHGYTVLQYSVSSKNWELVQWLVDHNACNPYPFFGFITWLFYGCPKFSLLLSLMIQDRVFVFIFILILIIVRYYAHKRREYELEKLCNAIRSIKP